MTLVKEASILSVSQFSAAETDLLTLCTLKSIMADHSEKNPVSCSFSVLYGIPC